MNIVKTMEITHVRQWEILRTEADEDASPITIASEGDWAQKPSAAIGLPDGGASGTGMGRKVSIIASAGAAADKTFTVNVYRYQPGGPLQRVCSIAFKTGTMQVVKYPVGGATATAKFWADTADVTNYMESNVGVSDGDGENGCSEVTFYVGGAAFIFAEVVDANGAALEAGNVAVYWRYRN